MKDILLFLYAIFLLLLAAIFAFAPFIIAWHFIAKYW